MTASIYKQTATVARDGKNTLYAFGRRSELDGADVELGGYYVFKCCANYDGKSKSGLRKTWRYVDSDMSYADAVSLINNRLKYEGWKSS